MFRLTYTHPILARINHQKDFLEMLLNDFPSLFNKYDEEIKQHFKESIDNIDKDYLDIGWDLEKQCYEIIGYTFEERDLFYQAMFLMVYAYYESFVSLLAKNLSI